MLNHHPFSIYNASAGSGKTHTLVQSYLKILFTSKRPKPFQYILAITFTNKAVAEMKTRIVDTLKRFSDRKILNSTEDSMFNTLCKDLKISPEDLHKQSKPILTDILYNYAAFNISTIDGFTHRLIRTFAFDLNLPPNFEVELDEDSLLSEAVDRLIAKAGSDKSLTALLVDFAIEKANDDKSWDISYDFNTISKLLVKENDIIYINKLKDKTLSDFRALKKRLQKEIKEVEYKIVEDAKTALDSINNVGLEFNDFNRGLLPNYFKNLSNKKFKVSYGLKWQENLDTKILYPKRVSNETALIIEGIKTKLVPLFNSTKQHVFHLKFITAFHKNIIPLSVLNAIKTELVALKAEQSKLLISEFNTLISEEIKNQPTPFIYERIGEKFKHYFIDEFQDTSVMQWENIIPLLNNALSTEGGSAMIVGDAKQAIYRWRGGKAEQFIGLCTEKNPLNAKKFVKHLPSNYRSAKEIVLFNNGLFNFISKTIFNKLEYISLYKNAPQEIEQKQDGYVELNFLDFEKDDDKDDIYCKATLDTIKKCLEHNFEYRDITIILRKKKNGMAIANFLSNHGIPVLASDTLLLSNSKEVLFVNNILAILKQPENKEVKVEVLYFLADYFKIIDKHQFFCNHIALSNYQLFEALKTFNVYINSEILLQLPLYELVESIIRDFKLVNVSNAYIQYYLDVVLDFYQKNGSDVDAFLEFWDEKKASLTIVSAEDQNAINILTIHKAKGLEFPVVIFPYADLDLYQDIKPKKWINVPASKYHGFSTTLLDYTNDFEHFGAEGQDIYNTYNAEKRLDAINLLYVALTRAKQHLYIITKNEATKKADTELNRYSEILKNYLQEQNLWEENNTVYSFGYAIKHIKKTKESRNVEKNRFISNAKEKLKIKIVSKSGLLWDTKQQDAMEKGNLIHNVMAKIKTEEDIDTALQNFKDNIALNTIDIKSLKEKISKIIYHPHLKQFFSRNSNFKIYNERDIIMPNGTILRPDRLNINKNSKAIYIIDYKTGKEQQKHVSQINLYEFVLKQMNYTVKEKILVYLSNNITVKIV